MGDEDRERRLRALRLERREQQEELEEALVEAHAAARTMAQLLRAHGERGDRVAVDAGPHTLAGTVHHVTEELVTLAGDGGQAWDLRISAVSMVVVVQPGSVISRVGHGHPRTLLARARELAAGQALVDVGRIDREQVVRGRVVAVSPDVVELERVAGQPVVLAWPAVAWLSVV